MIVGLSAAPCAGSTWAFFQPDQAPAQLPAPPDPVVTPAYENLLTDSLTWGSLVLTAVVLFLAFKLRWLGRGALGQPRVLGDAPAIAWLVAAMLAFLAPAIGHAIGTPLAGDGPRNSPQYLGTIGLATHLVSIPVAVGLALYFLRTAPQSGLRPRGRAVLVGAGLMMVCAPIVQLASQLATHAHQLWTAAPIPDAVAHSTLRSIVDNGSDPWVWVMGLVAVVGAPIYEELLYRGFLQTALLRATGRAWVAILATSALFAAAHILSGLPWYAIATLFVLAVCMGYAFERTRNIAVPIGMHMAFNAANIVAALAIA